jgi:hypothetical protein
LLSDLYGVVNMGTQASSLSEWLTNGGWPMLASGLVGAAIAWAVAYLGNDIWGAESTDYLKLIGTAMAASVAGSQVGDLAKGLTGGSANVPAPKPAAG